MNSPQPAPRRQGLSLKQRWAQVRWKTRTRIQAVRQTLGGVDQWRRRGQVALAVLGLLVASGLLVLLVTSGYRLIYPPDWYLEGHPGDTYAAYDAYRLSTGPIFVGLIQLSGGIVVGIGLLLAYMQYRQTSRQMMQDLVNRATDDLSHEAGLRRVAALHRLRSLGTIDKQLQQAVAAILLEFIRERAGTPRQGNERASDVREAIGLAAALASETKQPVDLSGLRIVGVNLSKLDLRSVNFYRCTFENVDLSGSTVDYLRWISMSGCNAQGLRISGSCDQSQFRDTDFQGAEFNRMTMMQTYFLRCKVTFAKVIGCAMALSTFEEVDFTGTQFPGTWLRVEGVYVRCKFGQNQFTEPHQQPRLVFDEYPDTPGISRPEWRDPN